jgi:hypothetical protein
MKGNEQKHQAMQPLSLTPNPITVIRRLEMAVRSVCYAQFRPNEIRSDRLHVPFPNQLLAATRHTKHTETRRRKKRIKINRPHQRSNFVIS